MRIHVIFAERLLIWPQELNKIVSQHIDLTKTVFQLVLQMLSLGQLSES